MLDQWLLPLENSIQAIFKFLWTKSSRFLVFVIKPFALLRHSWFTGTGLHCYDFNNLKASVT